MIMLRKRLLVPVLLAVGLIGAAATPLASVAATNIQVNYDAPARYDGYPAHRPGYVWVPGHRVWDGYRYVWERGHWERAYRHYGYRDHGYGYSDYGYRDGYSYRSARRDSDGDGVADRYDARPNNPYRY